MMIDMLSVRGVSYLIDEVPIEDLRRDVAAIRDELHCTAVMIIGSELEHLERAAAEVVEADLDVWIRPHLSDRPWTEILAHLEHVATAAERLRNRRRGQVTLLVGSEFSHTALGIVPGSWAFLRLRIILRAQRLLRRRITRRLDILLSRAETVARSAFGGPIGYGAASWEEVDWSRFDVVGVSLYRSGTDNAAYARRVASLVQDHAKPVIINEFGCGAFQGAEERGAGSFRIVDWFTNDPTIRGDHPRDEETQAAYLGELIDLYAASGVTGCFVFTFAMRGFWRSADPQRDLDMAGFGIVAMTAEHPGNWTPKAAFHTVADRYQALS